MVDMFIALEEAISLTQHLNLSLAAEGAAWFETGVRRKIESRLCRAFYR